MSFEIKFSPQTSTYPFLHKSPSDKEKGSKKANSTQLKFQEAVSKVK